MSADTTTKVAPGELAETPAEVPARGWWQIVRRAWKEAKKDQVPLMAAGVAFYTFLALFPAMIAGVLLYGLMADPATAVRQADRITSTMPADAASLITTQMKTLTESPTRSLGLGLVVALVLALWSAAGGVGNLITALNIAYGERETRGFVKLKALALALTLAAIVFLLAAIGLVAVAPAVLGNEVDGPLRWVLEAVRWVLVVALVSVALAVVYRVGPSREPARFSWISIGATTATVLWLCASVGFSVYVANFGSYAKTYGAMAGVVVLLLWLWITIYIVLLGAEINAAAEEQTARDTTTGPERPRGDRGAVKADSVAGG